jgi:hypothetical protein
MAWQTPKTDWKPADGVSDFDMNRIEGNTLQLRDDLDKSAITVYTAGGSVNAYTVTIPNYVVPPIPGVICAIAFTTPNTTTTPTLTVNGQGPYRIWLNWLDQNMPVGYLRSAFLVTFMSNTWRLVGQVASGGLGGANAMTTTAGSGTAYILTIPNYTSRQTGWVGAVKFHTTNTSTTPTLNINSTGASTLQRKNRALVVNEIASNEATMVYYDGSSYEVFASGEPYAQPTVPGLLKCRLDGADLYITNTNTNP